MLRLGVIGFGSMGQWLVEAFDMLPDLEVAGIAEIAPEAIRAAQALGIQVFNEYEELLDQTLDGVYIASPNDQHKAHVIAAAERHIPLFVEKPITLTLSDAKEMVHAVEAAGIPSLVNFSYRFTPPYERMRWLLKSGALGELRACWMRSFRGYGFYSNGVAHPGIVHPEQSGGWVIHHSIHGVDWLTSIAGPVASVAAQLFASSQQAPCEEGVFAQLKFHNGVVGHLAELCLRLPGTFRGVAWNERNGCIWERWRAAVLERTHPAGGWPGSPHAGGSGGLQARGCPALCRRASRGDTATCDFD